MQQMIDEDGNLWTIGADGAPVFAGRAPSQAPAQPSGPQPFTMGRANPAQQYDVQLKQQQVAENAADAANAPLRQQLLAAQVAQAQAAAEKARQGTAGAATGDAKLAQRMASLRALGENIARVRELHQDNLKGGWPNAISGRLPGIIRPENEQFNSAGAGLGETGLAAFRVPGVGSQSDAELKAFIDANRPQSSDSDLAIEEKLRNLETRLNATMESMGQGPQARGTALGSSMGAAMGQMPQTQGPLPQNGPNGGGGHGGTVLPQAAGAQADSGQGQVGVTSDGGLRYEKNLSGLPGEVMLRIRRGDSLKDITSYMDQQYAPYGANVGPDMAAAIATVIAKHRADPGAPIKSLIPGWENMAMLPANQPSTALGRFADSDLGNFTMQAANAATFGLPAYLSGKQDVMSAAATLRPKTALAGEIAGGTGAMLATGGLGSAAAGSSNAGLRLLGRGLTRSGGIGGDMLYGGVRGGLEDGPTGAITGALAAGAGNKIGGGIADRSGRIVRGVSSPAVRYLAEKNIPMTMGQMLGNRGMAGRFMNKLESVPFLGDALQQRRMEGVEAFNREAFKQAVDPISGPTPGFVGAEGIDAAQQAVGQAYDDAYRGISLTPDQQFAQQAAPFVQQGSRVPVMGEQFDYIMQNKIAPLGEGGALDGPRLQAALQALKGARSSFAKEGAMGNEAADAVSGVETALNDMVARQAPGALPQINAANLANRNVSTLGDAVLANNDGLFTPAQLRRAGINNTKKFGGKNKAARGDIPFKELVGYGQDVLPSTVPNSGTVDRGLASALLPAALGGSAVGAQQLGSPEVAGPLAILAALSSKQGAKITQKALTGRTKELRALGVALRKQKRRAGLFGAAAGTTMLPESGQ